MKRVPGDVPSICEVRYVKAYDQPDFKVTILQEAFDSAAYTWMLEVFHVSLVKSIADLTSLWATILKLNTMSNINIAERISQRRM